MRTSYLLALATCLCSITWNARSQNHYLIDVETESNGKIKSITPVNFTFYEPFATNASIPGGSVPTVISSQGDRGFALEVVDGGATYCSSTLNAPNVNLWSRGGLAVVYLLAVLYLFLGVSIVADVFMSAIEVITSQERTIVTLDPTTNESIEINVQVWNETVANLTLMALGSSAPEILLAVLETVTTLGQPAGPLGASTIVGSAAFNLFIISGVCVISVPERNDRRGEAGFRTLSQLGVFLITAFASVWAYFWMLVVLVFISPGRVELWEGLVTFLQFPILVGAAYAQDANYFEQLCGGSDQRVGDSTEEAGAPTEVRQKVRITEATVINENKHTAFQLIKSEDPTHLQLEDNEAYVENLATKIAATQPKQKISRMQYRVNATRMLAGKKPLFTVEEEIELKSERRKSQIEQEERQYEEKHAAVEMKEREPGPQEKFFKTTFEFASRRYAVKENEGDVKVAVRRTGDLSGTHTVHYRTADGTATENEDYRPIEGTLVFNAGEGQQILSVEIIEDEEVEDDEEFFIILENPTGESVRLGQNNVAQVIIIDVSQPGMLQFKHRSERVRETDGAVKLTVERVDGQMDRVGCKFETRDGTALEGQHYKEMSGEIEFLHGETEKEIIIEIIDNEEVESERQFSVVLLEPFGKATLNENRVLASITISDDERYSKLVNRVIDAVNARKRVLSLSTASWRDQVKEAMEVGDESSILSYFAHALAFPWKVLFSFIPPTTYYNGWLTFCVSLACVGAVTYVIGEWAGMLGCVIGISEEIVAITLVAMGTSMPDTFASRTATILAPDADAAIGNITGSNSVNVFLGLGLPWLIAAGYAAGTGSEYIVPAGTLDFAVTVFTPCAAATLGTLVLRRYYAGGELGGDYQYPTFFFFILLWGLFIMMSILKSTGVV